VIHYGKYGAWVLNVGRIKAHALQREKTSQPLQQTKKCKSCLIDHALNDFYPSKRGKFGRHSYCKICFNWKYKRKEKK